MALIKLFFGLSVFFFLKKNIRFLNFSPSEKVQKFLATMGLDLQKNVKCASKTIEVVGKPFQVSLLESEKNAFFEPPKQAWSRANIRGITYTSLTYNRLTKRTDSFVCGLPLQRISVLWSSQILLSDSIEGSNDLGLELP